MNVVVVVSAQQKVFRQKTTTKKGFEEILQCILTNQKLFAASMKNIRYAKILPQSSLG